MVLEIVALLALLLAALPALLFLKNLRAYQPPAPADDDAGIVEVSVLIPARNEAAVIVAAAESVLASKGARLELLVMDDASQDETAELVSRLAARDTRVRLLHAPPLPAGWCGKQHACAVLALGARLPTLAFLDADVRLEPTALARLARFLDVSAAGLVSGIPRQQTGTFLEHLVVPLIHFVLLGFLPLGRMRNSLNPAYGAGCGQIFVARAEDYQQAGGHAAIRASFHDGLTLPRAFRRAGIRTDLCDLTGLAVCRMYRSAAEVWHGFSKNATEGLAAPRLIALSSVLLLGGQVAPFVLLAFLPWASASGALLILGGVACAYLPRLASSKRFGQALLGAVLHPVGVTVLVLIQWYSLARAGLGLKQGWKGRSYASLGGPHSTDATTRQGNGEKQ